MNKNSLLFWHPKIKNLPIPQPQTEIVPLTDEETKIMQNEMMPRSVTEKVAVAIGNNFTPPVFIRTDLASGKHGWQKTCFYTGQTELWKNLHAVLVDNLLADLFDFSAFVIREYIPMDSGFTAFYGRMPVNPERRYFIKDHKILCHHPYWPEDAIRPTLDKGLPPDWKKRLEKMNTNTPEDTKILDGYASKVAEAFDGFWSVDFCHARDGRWILIDMATGEESWHPKECEFNKS